MFVALLCAAEAAVMATNLCCADADDLMVKASLASPHVLHLHALAQGLQSMYTLTADHYSGWVEL